MADRSMGETVAVSRSRRHAYLIVLVVLPPVVLLAAVAVAWGRAIGPLDVLLALVMYVVNIFGISVGYHRLLTHRSFRCPRPVRVTFALAGALALQGPPTLWAAEHRRHHKYSDKPGDPHSPWAFGDSGLALSRGLLHAQVGWFYSARRRSNRAHWVPDLLADPDIRRVDAAYPAIVAASFLVPAAAGGLLSWSWTGFWTALFWAGLVRYAVVHHVTWSVNSVAHCFGDRAFSTRDRSSNVRWVALLTFGEGWHNWHHIEPTSARHGVLKGQVDPSAALIRLLERLGCAHDVHWPSPARIEMQASRHRARTGVPTR
ncbi:Delta-9 acyl-phospholipid desaturase [Actinomadura pelletieri DSM 43383]|uniref:Delta-9 acyl-phospholipid desaturase n=1 Tax=Actinomadura pelletieri DSM 43383 TaxID=1120940 RepID=A0A495QGH7_9ACTN|nr:acyl-CoA desaturase [Actinomadura pelletieri]RKS70985.1 Delta-9 acyl-phospholipid desaturase [Actinomadura pelletieri DSM 43383]